MKLEIKTRDGLVMAESNEAGTSLLTIDTSYSYAQYYAGVSLTPKQIDRLIKFLTAANKKPNPKRKGNENVSLER